MLWLSPPWDSVTYWSLDLETGGMDPRTDPILSVGMVPIRHGAIVLGEAFSSLVQASGGIRPASILAHHLVPGEVREAPPTREVLAEVERRLRGGALVVHHAAFDVGFLRRAFARERLRWPAPPVVDTVALLVKAARRARFLDPVNVDREPELNLVAARRALGLPEYGQHDALLDAIAAAELFLVLRRKLGATRLRHLT